MELTGLFPMLAWLQILLRLVLSEGTEGPGASPDSQQPTQVPAPPAPSLSLSPPSPVRGQQVQLTCSAPRGSRALGFIFYEQRSGSWEKLWSESNGTWRIITENSELSRTFTCSYRVQSSPPRQPHSQSLQSNAVTLLLAEPLPAPVLSLSPQHPVYVSGERVTLECSAPRSQGVAGYRFYKTHQGRAPEELPAGATGPLEMLTVQVGDPSKYSCAYWVLQASREIPSWRSPPVPIAVIAPLPAPRLTASPAHPVYVVGDAVALTCSIPGAPMLATVQFSKDGGELPSPLLSDSPTLQLASMGTGHAGTYSCQYRRWESGREISSPSSETVTISVLVPPAAPQLSVSPSHPSYISGDSITLTCSAPRGHTLLKIQFLKDGQNLDSQMPAPDPHHLSRALRLPPLAPSHSGAYSCGYWFLESGREIPSRPSGPIHILVLEPPPAPRLALAPPHPVYIAGEQVTLRCSAPQGEGVAKYRFYRQRRRLIPDRVPEPTGGARLELRAETGMAGLYVCAYWALRTGREVPSEESQPVSVSVTDPPGKPSVSLSPDYPAYVAGDRVEINCSAPPGACPMQYGLHKGGEPLGPLPGSAGNWWMDLQANGARNATRSFSCAYVELIQGREVPSYASDPVSVSVIPAPGAPSLRLTLPLPLYVTGETVTAECIVPAGLYVPRAHWVLRDGEALREQPGPQFPLNINPSDSGTYRCGYSTELHGRHLRSPPSDPVTLRVTDPPPQPALSVDPPSGVVGEGLPLLITCRAPGDASERRFHFYKDGAEIIPGDTGSEISTTEPSIGSMNFSVLSILQAGPSNTGEFSCEYEVNMSGRWILSSRSQAVNVTVTAWSLPVPLVAGCGGAATALALLLLLICLCRKKAASRRLSTSYWKSQELRRSRIMRRSTDISGVNMGLQQMTEGGWPQAASQDWGLLPKLPTEGPRPGQAAVGAAPLKGQKEEDDADSGAEFEFPGHRSTYTQVTFSCFTLPPWARACSASLEHVYSTPDL
ncbi:Fc receptor-like protein 5 [Chelonoidis abingdonii]|uniref:Fc receptor-like protein 5 n=1 Tax=Chelonoidis abingdonii TaxID=106734 RepID=UPI003F4973D7